MRVTKSKKLEKNSGFLRPKPKVGKAKPKALNLTDTSFRSKGIILRGQNLFVGTANSGERFSIHIAHLHSWSESQRREALSALASAATARQVPVESLFPKCLSLMTDGNQGVREQLLRLFRAIPAQQLLGYEDQIVLHLQTGLTHISAEVCDSSLDFLDWAVQKFEHSLTSCSGGWYKLLQCFMLILFWADGPANETTYSKQWSNGGHALERLSKGRKTMIKALETLAGFLKLGLAHPEPDPMTIETHNPYYAQHIRPHLTSIRAKPFARLGLYSLASDDVTKRYEDVEDRRGVFNERFRQSLRTGLAMVKRHGGELGRYAGMVQRVVDENTE